MTGRDLVLAAMKCESTPRTPWVPFVGVHGGKLNSISAADYLTSADHMLAGINKAVELYNPDGLPIAFDLQLEAEILGCELQWADENPPAVISHPLASGVSLEELKIPGPNDGRLQTVLETARQARERHPDIALYGLITGPFTLALHLLGADIFMRMLTEPDYVIRVFDFAKDVAIAVADYYIDAGCDIIALVDPMTSQIGPDQFKQFVSEPATAIFDHIRSRECLSSFFVCGHAQQNIEVMCDCRPDNVSVDENIPLDFVRDTALAKGVSFGGNMQLTMVLLLGDEKEATRHALDCLDLGGESGFILAPGCDLPYATPPENLIAVTELVHDPYKQQVARTLEESSVTKDILDMSEYGKSKKVIVDIITLDSEACAPCQYMVESVKNVAPQFKDIVEWREHKIKHSDSIQFMTSLMVKNIPTICIDGQITFVSRIPPKEDLIHAIQKRIYEKLRYKIRTQNGRILLFGKDEDECRQHRATLEQAIRELGADVDIRDICDEKERLSYGVINTPAVAVAKYNLRAEGELPPMPAIKEWIKEIM